jgi:hypothetical protein
MPVEEDERTFGTQPVCVAVVGVARFLCEVRSCAIEAMTDAEAGIKSLGSCIIPSQIVQ